MVNYDGESVTALTNGKHTDITPKELQALEKFKEAGLPEIAKLNDVVVTKALDLYMAGKTYHEISQTVSIKKELILYLAHKYDWYGTKIEHLDILDATLKERILHAKLINQNFVLQIQQFFTHKIGRKITKYMATNDEEIADKLDGKDLDRYYKAVELLDKLTTEKLPTQGRGPTVGLNLGEGVHVRKVGENEVIITPRNKTNAEMLSELANLKRKEEAPIKKDTYDIKAEEHEQNNERDKNES